MRGLWDDPHRRHLLLTLLVGAGLAACLAGVVESIYGFDLAMLLALAGGFPVYYGAVHALSQRKISADLAVSLAALAALYLGYLGTYPAENMYLVAAEVIFIMLIGEALEKFAIGRTRSGIAALLALRPRDARVRRDGHEHVVPIDEIRPDDVILLRPGDRIPVDGRVLGGNSSVDQSPITGESLPADKTTGDEVFAGTINLYGALEVCAERLGEDTTLERIIHLVEEAEATKAPTQRLADRCAGYFVPAVLLAAGLVWLLSGEVIRSVAVLVVACPCALVLATPTAIAAGIGRMVRRGVLVKGGTALEQLGRLRSVVFDKTGTLTLAKLRIARIVPAVGCDEAEVLRLGASVERHSEHPLGQLIVEEAAQRQLQPDEAADFVAYPGLGAEAQLAGTTIRVGSPRFLEQAGLALPKDMKSRVERLGGEGCTVVLVARHTEIVGAVAVQDTVRPGAHQAVARLRRLGIERIAMLTGDNDAAARSVADALHIDEVQSDLLPADKVESVRRMQQDAAPVAMVGDGINDAPSLVAADVGVAMAEIGTDVAIASADVVLLGDELRKLPDVVACGRATLRIVWQNILAFALVFNVLAVLAASFGWISPVAAAVVHQVSSLTVVLNSMRLLLDADRWRSRWVTFCETLRRRWRLATTTCFSAVLAGWLLSGFYVVSIGEVAVVQRFGKLAQRAVGPGLHYRWPYPFGRHRIVKPDELRRVEIGFRTVAVAAAEPPANEWNVQHRGGRTQRQADESEVLAGDENLVDVNLVVQYRVADPVGALLAIGEMRPDGSSKWDALVRNAAEAALRAEMSRRNVEEILGSNRLALESSIRDRVADTLRKYGAGFVVERICLADVHPPVEVVPSFREVAGAHEEKQAAINRAEAFRSETEALSTGQMEDKLRAAEAFRFDRTERARGRAGRFLAISQAAAVAPEETHLRIYWEAMEQLLAGRRKIILDQLPGGGRRRVFLGPKASGNLVPVASPGEFPEGTAREGNQQP